MTSIAFSRNALAAIERFAEFLLERDAAGRTLELIANAVEILRRHPYIGRRVEGGLRELVISRGRTGYIALYEFAPLRDQIVIFAVRHQLEAGYSADD